MTAVYQPLAGLLNRGIRASASARGVARTLEGRRLGLSLDPPGLQLTLRIENGELEAGPAGDSDARLSGSLLGFGRMLFSDPEAVLRSGAVTLQGDTDVAEGFQALLKFARPDAEEELSRVIGDVAAHEVGEAARGLRNWTRLAATSLGRSLTEYLQEERRDLPTRHEVNEFIADVDRIANDVERAAARFDRLQRAS